MLLLAWLPAVAQGAEALSLKQCFNAAFGLSPALKAEQFDIDAAAEEVIHQRTALLPSVEAASTLGMVDGYVVTPFSIVTGEDVDAGQVATPSRNGRTGRLRRADFAPYGLQRIELDYPLFQNGSILGLNDAPAILGARAEKQRLEWTRKLGEEKVVFDLCNAFFIAQWFQQKVARDQARVTFSSQRVEITQLMFELEIKLRQDVELAKAALRADEQTLASTRQSMRDSFAVLAVLIGKPVTPILRLGGEPPRFTSLPPLGTLLQQARDRHPAVDVQRSVADVALAKLRLDRAALWPRATFNTNYAVGENLSHVSTASRDTPTQFATGITVSVPVFDWGSRQAQVRESRAKLAAEQTRTQQIQMDISTSLARLYGEEQELARQCATLTQVRAGAENKAHLARAQREAGSLDQLAVVEGELALLAAEDEVETIRLLELEKYAALQQAAGGAWKWVQ